MVSYYKDWTTEYALAKNLKLDISGWDWVTVQFETIATAAINFNTTNDGGEINGVRDGSPDNSTGYQPVQGTNLATGTASTATAAAGSFIYRFERIGRYLQLTSATGTVSKLIIGFYKQY